MKTKTEKRSRFTKAKHLRKYHKAFVVMDGIPDWNAMFFRSFKKAEEYAQGVNERSDLPKARVGRL